MRLGLGVGANDTEAVLRSLPSMALRYAAHDATTRALAQWCLSQEAFAQVLHPSLVDSPGHGHWRDLCGDGIGRAAGLFSVMFKSCYQQAQIDRFCDALTLFKIGYSWGGPMSLVMPYTLDKMRQTWPSHLARGTLVRFSVGLEAAVDLQEDLNQALRHL